MLLAALPPKQIKRRFNTNHEPELFQQEIDITGCKLDDMIAEHLLGQVVSALHNVTDMSVAVIYRENRRAIRYNLQKGAKAIASRHEVQACYRKHMLMVTRLKNIAEYWHYLIDNELYAKQ